MHVNWNHFGTVGKHFVCCVCVSDVFRNCWLFTMKWSRWIWVCFMSQVDIIHFYFLRILFLYNFTRIALKQNTAHIQPCHTCLVCFQQLEWIFMYTNWGKERERGRKRDRCNACRMYDVQWCTSNTQQDDYFITVFKKYSSKVILNIFRKWRNINMGERCRPTTI